MKAIEREDLIRQEEKERLAKLAEEEEAEAAAMMIQDDGGPSAASQAKEQMNGKVGASENGHTGGVAESKSSGGPPGDAMDVDGRND